MRPIDADALKGEKFYSHERHEYCVSVYAIDTMPTIEPDRPHGEWIESKERKGHFYCSECVQEDPETGKWRETFDFKYPFCPNCGASMQANDRQVTGKLDERMCRDRLKEVFREASEIGGDLFHLSQIERIIDGEDWI